MHIAVHIGKRGHDLWVQGVAYIEDKRASGIMVVREQHSTRGHHVFRVMHAHRLLIGHQSRDQTSVCLRSRIRIDDCEKIIAFF